MSSDPMSHDIGTSLPMLHEPDADTKRKARLFVCSKAESAEDARTLLEMLGLLEES